MQPQRAPARIITHGQCHVASQFSNKQTKDKISAHGKSRLCTRANPRPAVTSTINSSKWKRKRNMQTTTLANTMLAPKGHHGTDLLMRKGLSDIIAAILNALPNATTKSSGYIREIVTFRNFQSSDCHACAQDRRPCTI